MALKQDDSVDIFVHLNELRGRLVRTFLYIIVATIIAWFFFDNIFALIVAPIKSVLKASGSKLLLTSITEAFMVQLQICLVSGLIIASPLLTFELWGFVSPALTKDEKKPFYYIMPIAVVLFALGVGVCYWILPVGFSWFLSYVPKDATLMPNMLATVLFTVKMLFAFGLSFEMPVILMLLGKIGIVNTKMLLANWRIAVFLCAVTAAVVTPSNDAFTMLLLGGILVVLYALSILLVKFVEKKS